MTFDIFANCGCSFKFDQDSKSVRLVDQRYCLIHAGERQWRDRCRLIRGACDMAMATSKKGMRII